MQRWRWVIWVGLVLLGACAPRVYVPPTPEGNKCKRECMVVSNTCYSGWGRALAKSIQCERQKADCLSTCPGAKVMSGNSGSAYKVKEAEPRPELKVTPEYHPEPVHDLNPRDAGWYVLKHGQQYGPVTFDDLASMVRDGTVTKSTIVRMAGGGAWGPAGERPELFPPE